MGVTPGDAMGSPRGSPRGSPQGENSRGGWGINLMKIILQRERVNRRVTMEVTHGETKGSPRGLPSGSPGVCYHQENLLVTVPVLLVFLSLHDVHVFSSFLIFPTILSKFLKSAIVALLFFLANINAE